MGTNVADFENKHGHPLMVSDKLGYDKSVGDEDWEKVKKDYVKLPDGTWKRKVK